MTFEPLRRFTHLLELSRYWRFPFSLVSRSIFDRNQINLGQFDTVLMFEVYARHRSISLTCDDDEALLRLEPHLEGIVRSMRRGIDFIESVLPKECERLPHGLDELLARWWSRGFYCHHLRCMYATRL